MDHVKVDFLKTNGRIKPLHGVGQPPLIGIDTRYFRYLKQAHIPFSRLHDVGGWFGGNMFVDIPNIFRDFDADPEDPKAYDFAFTDILIAGLMDQGCEPIYRLGVSIENFHQIKAYRIFPPEDPKKWARICEHIILHYNEGWANGFHYGIRYWEIWNEPDGHHLIEENAMWKGTPEEYFELYRVTSRHLKDRFGDSILVGGYASCGFYHLLNEQTVKGEAFGTDRPLTDWDERILGFDRFFRAFLKIVSEEKLPLDFFSYHSYASVEDTLKMQDYVERSLRNAGLENTRIQLNEWNTDPIPEVRGRTQASANACGMLIAMQDTKMELMCYYDAQIGASVYGGLFHPMTAQPLCTYYAFEAFGRLYALGTRVQVDCETEKLHVLAAKDGSDGGVLIVNRGVARTVCVDASGRKAKVYLIDEARMFEETKLDPECIVLGENQIAYLEYTL